MSGTVNPTAALRSMLVCLLKGGDDAGSADGAAQLAAWIMDTAKEARDLARIPETGKPALLDAATVPCGFKGCTLTPTGHPGPHRDEDGIAFAPSKAKPVRTMGPTDADIHNAVALLSAGQGEQARSFLEPKGCDVCGDAGVDSGLCEVCDESKERDAALVDLAKRMPEGCGSPGCRYDEGHDGECMKVPGKPAQRPF